MSFSAEIIADSKNEFGNRLTTVKATFPRYLLAEFNTHKMISKNSASSRAIPAKKLIDSVEKNSYIPSRWMKDHSGMQGTEYLDDLKGSELDPKYSDLYTAKEILSDMWAGEDPNGSALYFMIEKAREFNKLKVSKQISNRLLEPFMYHTALMSATEWENFFALRAEGAAEINFQKSAFMILDAMNASEPKQLKAGEWHLPYGDNLPHEAIHYYLKDNNLLEEDRYDAQIIETRVKIATARCAGVSYVVVGEDGKEESYEKLIHRHDERLVKPGHWSPMEHPAKAMNEDEYYAFTHSFILYGKHFDWYIANTDKNTFTYLYNKEKGEGIITEFGWCGNYRGFIMYRKMFINENKRDPRLIKK